MQPVPPPGPSMWAAQALYYCPLMCIDQILSHILLPHMLPNRSARALCLWDDHDHPLPCIASARVCCLFAKARFPWSYAYICCPTFLQQSSAPEGYTTQRPWPSVPVVLPKSSGPMKCLITLCSSLVVPSPSRPAATTSVSCQDSLPPSAATIILQNEKYKVLLFTLVPHQPVIFTI